MEGDKPGFPVAGLATDGWSSEHEASATCFCGAVQLALAGLSLSHHTSRPRHEPRLTLPKPLDSPGLVNVHICHFYDCHKITASMFASNVTVLDTHLRHVRGRDKLTTFAQRRTIGSGKLMTNYFCSLCGSLMYRVGEGFPGMRILRLGTVDDFRLHETKLRPQVEQYVKDRACWLGPVAGVSRTACGMAEY